MMVPKIFCNLLFFSQLFLTHYFFYIPKKAPPPTTRDKLRNKLIDPKRKEKETKQEKPVGENNSFSLFFFRFVLADLSC